MEHTKDDPSKSYKRMTFYIEDVRKFFQIAQVHGGEPKAVFSDLTPPGGKWTVTVPDELEALADKFKFAGDFDFYIAFPKVDNSYLLGVSIRTWLGLRLRADRGELYEATYADLDRYLTLLVEKHGVSTFRHNGRAFVPTHRPATAAPTKGLWERHRDDVTKALFIKPLEIIITSAVVSIITFFATRLHYTSNAMPATQPTTATSRQ